MGRNFVQTTLAYILFFLSLAVTHAFQDGLEAVKINNGSAKVPVSIQRRPSTALFADYIDVVTTYE